MKLKLKNQYKSEEIKIKKCFYYPNTITHWSAYDIEIIEITFTNSEKRVYTEAFAPDDSECILGNESEILPKYIKINSTKYDKLTKEYFDKFKYKLPTNINGFNEKDYSWAYIISETNAKKIKNIDFEKLKTVGSVNTRGCSWDRQYMFKDVIELANSGLTHNQAKLKNMAKKI